MMRGTKTVAARLVTILAAMVMAISLGAGAAFAQDQQTQEISPEQLSLARKYVDMTDTSKVFETMLLQAGIETMKTLTSQNPDLHQKVQDAIGVVIKGYIPEKGQLMDQFARVYALKFSKDELQKIDDFYSSPVGMKLTKENRAINKQLQAVIKVFADNLRTEFIAKVRAELKKEGVDL